jgi:cysteinyl-tRNA synthetase
MEGLKSATTAIDRLRNFKLRLESAKLGDGVNPKLVTDGVEAMRAFRAALDDDLNTAEALAAIFEFVREANTALDHGDFLSLNRAGALAVLEDFDAFFDVLKPSSSAGGLSDADVEKLIAERTAAKKGRDFARADQIRAQLLEQGIILEDTKDGIRWKRK